MKHKKCSSCKRSLSLDNFGNNPRSKDGLAYRCKTCGKKRRQQIAETWKEHWSKRDPYENSEPKTCKSCNQSKPREEFSKALHRKDGLQDKCKPCQMDCYRERTYGQSLQSGTCDICGAEKSSDGRQLSQDHCHESGANRGTLCSGCNTGLGLFKDNPQILKKAASYLTYWNEKFNG